MARKNIPAIHPREPLTKKAKVAITMYVKLRAAGRGGNYTTSDLISYTLQAERMPRVDLYAWLEAKHYRWRSQRVRWVELERKPKPRPAPAPAPTRKPATKAAKPAKAAKRKVAAPKSGSHESLDGLSDAELITLIQAGAVAISPAKSKQG